MKNSDYWRQRFESLEKTLDAIGQDTYFRVEPAFDDALREIDGQIEKWLNRIAVKNKLSMKDARKLLDADQLAEFHWSVEDYIKHGKENAIDQRWMKQLENASAKFHISKLEAMKLHTQQSLEKAFGNYLDGVDGMARKVYTEGYYRTAFELQKGFGVGYGVGSIDEGKLTKLIGKPWAADGKNFSDRIWQAKTQMVNDLHKQLVRTCITGKAPDEAIKAMMKYAKSGIKNAKAQAARLIMTEQAFFAAASTKDSYLELGVEEFEIVATLDSHTSEICQELDGRHFPMKDYEPGVTAPPFHVYCRSTTCPYFDDEYTADEMRAARGEDGKTYYVPANMKYEEWRIGQDIPHFSLLKGRKEIYSKEELEVIAKEINLVIDKYTRKDSKWRGNIVTNTEGKNQKLWDCSLNLAKNTEPYIVMHELLHARSISYFTPEIYTEYRKIEEATVEFFAHRISERENISIVTSLYAPLIDLLEKICDALGMKKDAFAKKLFETDATDRISLLENWAYDIMIKEGTISEYQEIMNCIDKLR